MSKNLGTCHKCSASLHRGSRSTTSPFTKCVTCGTQYHTTDCGYRYHIVGLGDQNELEKCPKCSKLCTCAGGPVLCSTSRLRVWRRLRKAKGGKVNTAQLLDLCTKQAKSNGKETLLDTVLASPSLKLQLERPPPSSESGTASSDSAPLDDFSALADCGDKATDAKPALSGSSSHDFLVPNIPAPSSESGDSSGAEHSSTMFDDFPGLDDFYTEEMESWLHGTPCRTAEQPARLSQEDWLDGLLNMSGFDGVEGGPCSAEASLLDRCSHPAPAVCHPCDLSPQPSPSPTSVLAPEVPTKAAALAPARKSKPSRRPAAEPAGRREAKKAKYSAAPAPQPPGPLPAPAQQQWMGPLPVAVSPPPMLPAGSQPLGPPQQFLPPAPHGSPPLPQPNYSFAPCSGPPAPMCSHPGYFPVSEGPAPGCMPFPGNVAPQGVPLPGFVFGHGGARVPQQLGDAVYVPVPYPVPGPALMAPTGAPMGGLAYGPGPLMVPGPLPGMMGPCMGPSPARVMAPPPQQFVAADAALGQGGFQYPHHEPERWQELQDQAVTIANALMTAGGIGVGAD